MLELSRATLGYPRRTLFRAAGLALRAGEVAGLIAPNGWGKTTLMGALAGRDDVLLLGGLAIDGGPARPGAGAGGRALYAPGDATLLDGSLSARDHLALARDVWRSPRSVAGVADELAIAPFIDRPVRGLSDGMRQLVTVAVARMATSAHLLLDEPTNALDPGMSHRVIGVVRRMAAEGRGVMVSSHILSDLDEMCDRLLTIQGGQVVQVPFERAAGACARAYRDCYGGGDAWEA